MFNSKQMECKHGAKSYGKIHHRYFARNQVTTNLRTELNPLRDEDATVKELTWEGDTRGRLLGGGVQRKVWPKRNDLFFILRSKKPKARAKPSQAAQVFPQHSQIAAGLGHRTTLRGAQAGGRTAAVFFPFPLTAADNILIGWPWCVEVN